MSAVGRHLLVDLEGCSNLAEAAVIEAMLADAAIACGATLLSIHLHGFGEGAGVTGVALLAESHISIHTWPETGFAALDIFVCGQCDPRRAIPVLERHLRPTTITTGVHLRGARPEASALARDAGRR